MTSPDPNLWQAAWAPYARYVPGFAFLQGLGAGTAAPAAAQWVAPVFDVEELERRIRDLKAVHFWLEQNARAVQATMQALEVQKLTLATLQGMNVSLGRVAQRWAQGLADTADDGAAASTAASPDDAAPPSDRDTTSSEGDQSGSAPVAGAGASEIDPVRFWRALTQQFQTIAAQALQDMTVQAARAAAHGVTAAAPSAASPAPAAPSTEAAGAAQGAARPRASRAAPAARVAATGSGAGPLAQQSPQAPKGAAPRGARPAPPISPSPGGGAARHRKPTP
ncbi:PhaM family polyhydroxyalkanoate granule multifunctional regulatory protein [Tepidimonas charontis]|uniref:Uncharacterized protein n=1 Tax=Tepidimonas charontis TaxID=2267262 RepID=A0A554XIE5_9BURK|nr:PhaM family polyhydroxyalkanoate granule multifunctional regulatory protein [Tepidimonas charontis]TSE35606.1 hypothetical protein Tchar_00596 [Tepidimonas charontis]